MTQTYPLFTQPTKQDVKFLLYIVLNDKNKPLNFDSACTLIGSQLRLTKNQVKQMAFGEIDVHYCKPEKVLIIH